MSLPTTFGRFTWHFIRRHKMVFLLAQIFSLGWTLDSTIWPYALKKLIDQFLIFQNDKIQIWHHLAPTLWFWALLWIGISAMFRIQGFILAWIFPRLEAEVRMAMFYYVMGHSYEFFANHFAGNVSNRISDITQSLTRVLQFIITLFIPGLAALIIAGVMFYLLQPIFSLLLVSWAILHLMICFIGGRRCSHYSELHSTSRSLLTGKVVDTLTNIINVKLFARKPFEMHYLSAAQKDEKDRQYEAKLVVEKLKIILDISTFLIPGVILTWYIIHCWQLNKINTGDVVLIFSATWNIQLFMYVMGLELPNFFRELGVCQQAMSLVQAKHDITDAPDATSLKVTQGKIEFDRVNFHYQPTMPVFENLSLTIQGGSKVGLVGFSGSGKSTFVNLLMRFFDIQSGQIKIDDQVINAVTINSLREQISMIPQAPTLFHRTLRENIAYGKPHASDAEIINAAKKAYCHDFISALPDGYNSLVGERGIKLSGGQRQRIAIARAILEDAPILILDEATAALDSVTERYIQDALQSLMDRKTTIVIAHRLSTLSQMDRILVFDKGKIIEEGTHDQLLQQEGHYAHMWRMQAHGFLPADEEVVEIRL